MIPTNDQLPLVDLTSGIDNIRRHGGARLRRADSILVPFLWGLLAGMIIITGIFLCLQTQ